MEKWVEWFKSSRSTANGNCVEVSFRRAGGCETNACVEASVTPNVIYVRDSKNPNGPVLSFTPGEWRAFLGGVRDGEFDL